jgi:hypothetical protein
VSAHQHLLPIRCPWCGAELECHDAVGDASRGPRPGDLALCWQCHRVCRYEHAGGTLGLRRATEQEARSHPQMAAALHAMLESFDVDQALGMLRRPR